MDLALIVKKSKILTLGAKINIAKEGLSVGRDHSFEPRLRLRELAVSRYHCHFVYNFKEQEYYIVDFGSKHGTFVNGIRLTPSGQSGIPFILKDGNELKIGSTEFLVHFHTNESCFCDGLEMISVAPTKVLDRNIVEKQEQDIEKNDWISVNKGAQIMKKMGWKGKGLGKQEQGIVEPIKVKMRKMDGLGYHT